MQSGVISNDNFSQVVRGISQKRKHGLLELNCGEDTFQIAFYAGKIIEFIDLAISPGYETAQRLAKAGFILPEMNQQDLSVSELFTLIDAKVPGLTEDIFVLAVRHRILDRLYALDLGQGSYYTFNARVYDADRSYLPSLSSGQLLLDQVALKDDADKFFKIFSEDKGIKLSEDAKVESVDELPVDDPEEKLLLGGLLGQVLALNELKAASLLSELHFRECLISLYERNLIALSDLAAEESKPELTPAELSPNHAEVDTEEARQNPASGASEDMLAALDSSIDEAFANEGLLDDEDAPLEMPDLDAMAEDDEEGQIEDATEPPSLEAEINAEELPEEDFEDDDDLYEEGPELSNFRISLNLYNMKLLRSEKVPLYLNFIFIILALFSPFILWSEIFSVF